MSDATIPERVHLIGVGGAGMSALAKLLWARGHQVSGSDLRMAPSMDNLSDLGADVWEGSRPEAMSGVDLVVASSAVPERDWERRAASFLFALPSSPAAVLMGKNLATTIALLVETMAMAVIAAWLTGGWSFLAWVPLIAVTAIGCQLAVGNLASVITPLRLPDMGSDVFSQSSEQGCLAVVSQLISFSVMGLLMVPVAVAWVLVAWDPESIRGGLGWLTNPAIVSVISVIWGAAMYAIGTSLAVRLVKRRLPEVLAWVEVA